MKAHPHSTALTLLLGGLMSILPLALDPTLPALPAIQAAFAAGSSEVQAAVTLFMLGVSAGQFVYGPLADRFGRRPILIGTLLAYAASAIASVFAPSLGWLVAYRFLQGLAGGAGPVLARTIVRDLLANEPAARLLSRAMIVFAAATIVGPLVGGFLVSLSGWQAVFVALAALGAALAFAVYRMLPETAPSERQSLGPRQLGRNFAHLLSRRAYLAPTTLAVISQVGVFVFVTNSALVIVPALGCTPAQYAWVFALVMLGHILGVQIGSRSVERYGIPLMLLAGALLSCAGGVLLAAFAFAGVHAAAALVAPLALYMMGNGLIMPSASAAALTPFPRLAGCAASLQSILYLVAGALAGMGVSFFLDGTTRPLACAIAACGAGLLIAERLLNRSRADVPHALHGA